jgi:hypothetical protein
MTRTVRGMVDVYKAKAGRVGIDACVPLSVAVKMFKLMSANGGASSDFCFYQTEVGGLVAIDAQVSAPMAAAVLGATAVQLHSARKVGSRLNRRTIAAGAKRAR